MSVSAKLFPAPGELIAPDELRLPKARAFAAFVHEVGTQAYATLIELRRRAEPIAEIVVVEVEVQRPQDLVHQIARKETIAIVFDDGDQAQPAVLALRRDFPSAPHVFLTDHDEPRHLCLYEQPYANERLNWTPARFLKRIREWLAKTANGTLHADDQPLEPLIAASPARLVLPANLGLRDLETTPGLLDIYRIAAAEDAGVTLVAFWQDNANAPEVHAVAAVFSCEPQAHTVMRRHPQDLQTLRAICADAGLDLAAVLAAKIREWHLQKPTPQILNAKLVIILLLPKTRTAGSIIESTEVWAFMTLDSVQAVGIALEVIQTSEGVAGYVIGEQQVSGEKLSKLRLFPVHVLHAMSPMSAAKLNGLPPVEKKIVGIGMGALGSQIFNNFLRAGYGRWTVVDSDIFLPHNSARHWLGQWAVGQLKVTAIAHSANDMFHNERLVEPIPADVLSPAKHREKLMQAFAEAEVVFDFSASVAVARHLAVAEESPRAISAFLTPSGTSLVLLAEDDRRNTRLDWLEMLHYRAVLTEETLHASFASNDERFRYGNSCRDISARLAQDDVAMWAAVASKGLKELARNQDASLRIYCSHPDGRIFLVQSDISQVVRVKWYDWTVQLDVWLLKQLARFRSAKLPNETGGILLGNFDTHHRVCSLVGLVPSPGDSSEWPTSYIRGCAGLRQRVEEAESRTIGQISYAGEWHSHPDKCDVSPSTDDLKAYGWLVGHMHVEGLPAIMLIIGERDQFCIVTGEPSV